jgi:hypothetical protein
MNTMALKQIPRTYSNNGQHAEQTFRFTLTGKVEKSDNIPCTVSGDCGNIQIKSARATICRGTDISAHAMKDAASRYAYVTADFSTAYIMTKTEYVTFAKRFSTLTRESARHGGAEKLRFKSESAALINYLNSLVH